MEQVPIIEHRWPGLLGAAIFLWEEGCCIYSCILSPSGVPWAD